MKRVLAAALAVAYVALIVFCVSTSDEEPISAFILVSCGGSLTAQACERLTGNQLDKVPRPWWWWLIAATVSAVAGVTAATSDASTFAAVSIGLVAGTFVAATLTPVLTTAPRSP